MMMTDALLRRGCVAMLGVCLSLSSPGCQLSGGGGGDGEGEPPGELVQSEKARVTSPDVPDDELAGLVSGNSTFAFALYEEARGQGGNIFYSPYSISIALAMTYAGARSETEEQMAEVMRFTLAQDRLHPAFNALDLELASRGEGAAGADGEGFRLNIVNRIWGQIGYAFLSEFLDVLAVNYGTGLSLLDFSTEPEESRVVINDWVAEHTEERIEDLIPEGAITSDTRLVLTNAVYFNAAWSSPFEEESTRDRPFNLLDGGEVAVPMMNQVETFGYAAGDGYEAVELLYDGGELSMVIFLPEAGRFGNFEETLDAVRATTIVGDLTTRNLDLTMPRFTFRWETSLRDALETMGMTNAFLGADFSGMDGRHGLAIQDVIHQAFVLVNEQGTEAAAATAVIIGETAAPEPEDPLVVVIDRPFLFFIRDIETETILFLGRVLDPSV
jgi:serpin B